MAQSVGVFADAAAPLWRMVSDRAWSELRQASEVLAGQSYFQRLMREAREQRWPHMVVYRDGEAFHVPPDHIALVRKGDRVWIVPGTTP